MENLNRQSFSTILRMPGAKKVFTLGQVSNTAEVREKLAKIKRLLFPELRIADFLPEHESIGLVWTAK
jgi:hypothetical protein